VARADWGGFEARRREARVRQETLLIG